MTLLQWLHRALHSLSCDLRLAQVPNAFSNHLTVRGPKTPVHGEALLAAPVIPGAAPKSAATRPQRPIVQGGSEALLLLHAREAKQAAVLASTPPTLLLLLSSSSSLLLLQLSLLLLLLLSSWLLLLSWLWLLWLL